MKKIKNQWKNQWVLAEGGRYGVYVDGRTTVTVFKGSEYFLVKNEWDGTYIKVVPVGPEHWLIIK